jgi:hypothetical protein
VPGREAPDREETLAIGRRRRQLRLKFLLPYPATANAGQESVSIVRLRLYY